MTETVGTQAGGGEATPTYPANGLRVERVHTTAGVHPYDQVAWERRDVVMTNWRDGSVNFEQRGVEFPDLWSVNAANIVTTKYFRGAVGTPQRESSLRQLIHRVVRSYQSAGERYGYFASPEDAEIFGQELTWMLLHQVFSFNSPVWFNVGTAAPQQVSACQPYHSLVSTPSGLVPIGELVERDAVGTKVYDADGITRIVATKANGVKDVLRLHTGAGHVLDVTADHLVWRGSGGGTGRFVLAGDLRPGDQLEWHRRTSPGEDEILDLPEAAPPEAPLDPDAQASDVRRLAVDRIERLGPMEVCDIQTESGEYLSGGLRVHNCFILSVEDTMDSILNWYREEGLIFKGGSGAGVNLSRIRSSKELLSSGGTASGPVSFMRGADASAGTIKSGGATRRAAKMVVLDVDHPNVEEFIETKAREERKIRVLRDAGYDMDLGGTDIASVQYQNANNSVRVSDEFMKAVEEGRPFGLRARLTNGVLDTVDAKTLFRKMSQAAWECADPGIQYDDTINDWHTNPETGRITASNPCFPADARVLTDRGLIRIGDLLRRAATGERSDVYTNDVTSPHSPSPRLVATTPVRYLVTGTNEIVELRFSDGSRLRCTPRHRVWTDNRRWVHADELTAEDRVVRSFHHAPRPFADEALPAAAVAAARAPSRVPLAAVPAKWDVELAHYLGWLVGAGRLTRSTAVTVYGGPWEQEHLLPRHDALLTRLTGGVRTPSVQANGTRRLRASSGRLRALLAALGVSTSRSAERVVPEAIFEAPEEALRAFLRGLFDADGCVVDQESNGTCYVGLGSRSEELLLGVQELLASLGIRARINRTGTKTASFAYVRKDGTSAVHGGDGPSYDLRITASHLTTFRSIVGFDHAAKAVTLDGLVAACTCRRVIETVTLESRESRGFETTYNLTEPRNHSYVVSGVVVANCSEYMSLDNSSCNLASLNLLKFLREDGTFDGERFVKAVEFIITAMDISISFADFPTEKITETTRAYRQLGIGYANLGALLMATGHAYDSDGGRALAAAITSLMTGASYRRSAELAGAVGPYQGYSRNASAHQRVMRKHAAANDAVRTVGADDGRILALATQEWQQGLRIGAENGWRNAQASLLAPTGTIGFMMDCDTTGIEPDFSLVKFKKLVGGGSMQIVNQTVPRALRSLGYQDEQVEAIVEYVSEHGHVVDAPGLRPDHYKVFDCAMGARSIAPMGHVQMMAAVQPFLSGAISKCVVGDTLVASADGLVRIGSRHDGEPEDSFRDDRLEISSLDGPRKTDAFYYGGVRPVRRVTLRSGHTITGTDVHRLLVAGQHGIEWKHVGQIVEGDHVAIQYGAEMWSTVPASLRHVQVSSGYRCQLEVTLPAEMSAELAFLLGAYACEGHTNRSAWTVAITNSVDAVLDRVEQAWRNVFGLEARIVRQPGKCPAVVATSKTAVEFMEALGCGSRASDKRIPDTVLRSPRDMVLAFLQGLALDADVTTGTSAKWAICLDSPRLLDDLQAVLTNLGVVHSRISKHNVAYDKYHDEVNAAGRQGQLMVSLVPFTEPDKAARAAHYLTMDLGVGPADVVPGVTGRELYELIPSGRRGRNGVRSRRSVFRLLLDPRTQQVSRRTLEWVASVPAIELPEWLRQIVDGNLHFSPVASTVDAGEAEVYDLSVPVTHAFVGNGIVNHNTVNMPESATVDDVERIYHEGWKLGLKALAIYRDNCKVGQPLSDGREKKEAATALTAAVTEHRPTRKRLPKRRPSQTLSFSVGGAEGYATSSSYPDDGLGELFVKMSKQGSTLAGVMDAFSIAISIALQYGVPLETYVTKFVNMRFDPAGMTDDPDIRIASSVMDYLFRRLALDYLPYERRAELGIFTADERAATIAGQYGTGSAESSDDDVDVDAMRSSAPVEKPKPARVRPGEDDGPAAKPVPPTVHSSTELIELQQGTVADAPLCFTCGTKMRPAGSCYVCEGCGSTSGCS